MSDKTLVELLREAAKNAREERGLPVYTPDQLEKLADAIEREYLPRPRFEDGELVNIGDQFEFDGESFHIRDLHVGLDKKTYIVARERDGLFDMEPGERVKRPEPEVLDADGIPIRVGDHVWFKQGTHYDGVEYVVTEVTKTQVHYENSEGEYPRGGCPHYCASSNLTHKQPDSLERIEADAKKSLCDYWGCYGVSCNNCPAKTDGKKPRERYGTQRCNDAMRLDLLRRQREVLERDHER